MKVWCSAGSYFYFRKWQINNAKAIPDKGPIIFIPTHQNAFMDAILVVCSTPRNPWSIARASVFKKGIVTKLLTAVQIKPVFRIRDGWSSLKNNDAIMQEWTDMLAQGQDITIFAEGNHNEPYAKGTLQRGFARMALKFQQQHATPLSIIPVGLHYDAHYSFRSRVLVNFGDPIAVDEVVHASLNEREKLDRLVSVTEESLSKLAIGIEPDDQYRAKVDFLMKYRRTEKDMLLQLESDRTLLNAFPNAPHASTSPKKLPPFLKVINPVVWAGWLLHIIPYSLIKSFIRKKIKDPQWTSSIKYAFGIFLVPLYYVILLTVCFIIFRSIPATIILAILLPLLGIGVTDILKK